MGENEVRKVRALGFTPMQNPKAWTFIFADFSDVNNNRVSSSYDNGSLIEKNGHIVYLSLRICSVRFVD